MQNKGFSCFCAHTSCFSAWSFCTRYVSKVEVVIIELNRPSYFDGSVVKSNKQSILILTVYIFICYLLNSVQYINGSFKNHRQSDVLWKSRDRSPAASSPQQREVSHDVCSRNIKGRNPSDKQSQSCTGRDPFVFVMHLNYHYSPDAWTRIEPPKQLQNSANLLLFSVLAMRSDMHDIVVQRHPWKYDCFRFCVAAVS